LAGLGNHSTFLLILKLGLGQVRECIQLLKEARFSILVLLVLFVDLVFSMGKVYSYGKKEKEAFNFPTLVPKDILTVNFV
jgi:hypothetical protein